MDQVVSIRVGDFVQLLLSCVLLSSAVAAVVSYSLCCFFDWWEQRERRLWAHREVS